MREARMKDEGGKMKEGLLKPGNQTFIPHPSAFILA
jgi:hypothetical protein